MDPFDGFEPPEISLARDFVHQTFRIVGSICAERRESVPDTNGEELVLYALIPGSEPIRVANIGTRGGSLVEMLVDDGTGAYLIAPHSQVSIIVRFETPKPNGAEKKEIGFHTGEWQSSIPKS